MRARGEPQRAGAGTGATFALVGFSLAACRADHEERASTLTESEALVAPPAIQGASLPPWSPDEGRGVQSNAAGYWVSVLAPEAWPQNEEFDLVVRVLDGPTRRAVVRDAEIRVDARMPAHGHGMTRDATLEIQPDGSWLVRGMLFHMVGHWELYVDLRRGAITERAQIDIDLE